MGGSVETYVAPGTKRATTTEPSVVSRAVHAGGGKKLGWVLVGVVGLAPVVVGGLWWERLAGSEEGKAGQPASSAGYVRIEPGTFRMGSSEGEKGRGSDETQHEVELTYAFMMKATEVTQGEWRALMGSNPSHFDSCGTRCPVEQVSWYEAVAYANAVSKEQGVERCYKDGSQDYDGSSARGKKTPSWPKGLSCEGYRLPTEAEWEYAARAGTTTAFHTGRITQPTGRDPNLNRAGWYDENSGSKTHPVGQKAANAWGLYDMHGNVYEWVWDWYDDYGSGKQTDPVGPSSGTLRVRRGGSWYYGAGFCRSAVPNASTPGYRDDVLGFRLSRSIP